MKHDNSCLSCGQRRVREAGRREEIACFIPRQTSGKVRRESGFSPGIFRIWQSLALRGTNGIRIELCDFFFCWQNTIDISRASEDKTDYYVYRWQYIGISLYRWLLITFQREVMDSLRCCLIHDRLTPAVENSRCDLGSTDRCLQHEAWSHFIFFFFFISHFWGSLELSCSSRTRRETASKAVRRMETTEGEPRIEEA